VVARTVMARLSVLAAGLAEAAARSALGLVCGGVRQVDQRGVHDTGNVPPPGPGLSGGWQASSRCSSRLVASGSRTPFGGCPNPPGRLTRDRFDAVVSCPRHSRRSRATQPVSGAWRRREGQFGACLPERAMRVLAGSRALRSS
jgi:hypothetical protein